MYATMELLNARDNILFCSDYAEEDYIGGIKRFQDLNGESLIQLIFMGAANPFDAQNDSPYLGEFCEFLNDHPNFTCHGYAVSGERPDVGVSVEGLYCSDFSEKDVLDFYRMCSSADSIKETDVSLYSWWD